jgi:hypothetical protein
MTPSHCNMPLNLPSVATYTMMDHIQIVRLRLHPNVSVDSKRHIDAWNNLEWVESCVMLPKPKHYASCGGVFVALVYNGSSLTCIQLPSQTRDIPLRIWKLPNTDFIAMDMAADPRTSCYYPVSLTNIFLSQTSSRIVHRNYYRSLPEVSHHFPWGLFRTAAAGRD